MNAPGRVTLEPFQQWLLDAMASVGVEVGDQADPLGCEFEAEGRLARVIPHRDPNLAVVEVEVLPLAEVPQGSAHRLVWELMKLNHEARFEHEWAVIIDDDDVLSISATVIIGAMRGEALGETLFDGVERAARLATVAQGLLAAFSGSSQQPAPRLSGHLRV